MFLPAPLALPRNYESALSPMTILSFAVRVFFTLNVIPAYKLFRTRLTTKPPGSIALVMFLPTALTLTMDNTLPHMIILSHTSRFALSSNFWDTALSTMLIRIDTAWVSTARNKHYWTTLTRNTKPPTSIAPVMFFSTPLTLPDFRDTTLSPMIILSQCAYMDTARFALSSNFWDIAMTPMTILSHTLRVLAAPNEPTVRAEHHILNEPTVRAEHHILNLRLHLACDLRRSSAE
eukprot:SAG11_NODE_476_length_9118_cov_5.515911_2_plen_234_part_00